MKTRHAILWIVTAAVLLGTEGLAGKVVARVLSAVDSLSVGEEPVEEARVMLAGLAWEPESFQVRVSAGTRRPMVRFPSPRPRGSERNDTVVMEWFQAQGTDLGTPRPALLVLHILSGNMEVARAVAAALSANGVHCFCMHMPDYGERGDRQLRKDVTLFVPRAQQAVADARRAWDAIAVLPGVDPDRIGIQGTSLGGFVAASAAALDGCFDPVFLMLAGGDLAAMVKNGRKDTAKIREAFARAGVEPERLEQLLRSIDPATLAHRLDPARTWLYSALFDQVVPPANATALGKAAHLDEDHHVWLLGNHYTCLPFLPGVLVNMRELIDATVPR